MRPLAILFVLLSAIPAIAADEDDRPSVVFLRDYMI
jgi:hypothetical protein